MIPGPVILYAVFAILYVVFLVWYGGKGKPLTQAEVDAFMADIKRAAGVDPNSAENHNLKELRELAKSDDGGEYYMLNLQKFRKKALYKKGGENKGGDALAADKRYNRTVIPLLVKHGGMPFFSTKVMGRFIHPEGSEDWDHVAMVRYRSRRDNLKMVVDLARKRGDKDKWAALEKTQVFPLKPLVSLITVRMTIGLILFFIATLLHLALSGLKVY